MADCVIVKRHDGQWAWALETSQVRAIRQWCAACPDCGTEVVWRGSPPTRKNTKDALYRHRRERHGLGSVGRADGTNRRTVSGIHGSA